MYKRSKATYQRALRAEKCKSWAEFRKSATSGDAFKALATFSGKSKSISLPQKLLINGLLTSDPDIIVDACACHFFPSDESHFLLEEQAKSTTDRADVEQPTDPISVWELEAAVSSLNPDSAPGADGISVNLLLVSMPLIKAYLLLILNACLSLCYFPDGWKISLVLVLGKPNKDNYSTLNSFRPISLVSNLAKILEKIILGRLVWLAQSFDWISNNQHGFREGHSTETAAYSIISFIESAFRERQACATAFLDIKSAFDSAWHPAIIAALGKRSCPPYLAKLSL